MTMFGPKNDALSGELRKLDKKEVLNYFSPIILVN